MSIRLGHEDLEGNDILAVTNSQAKNLVKAHENGRGITIRMSSNQLKHNMKTEGGFLGLLAGLAARALPMLAKTVLAALGVGALSGLASSGVQKAMGSGLYFMKGGCVSQVETDGSGLYSTLLADFAQVREPRWTNLSAANLLYRYQPRKRGGRVTAASENIGQLHSRR